MKVVHVRWYDPAFASSGWMDKSDFEKFVERGLSRADTVGMLAHEGADFIVVLQSVGVNQVADAVKIARSCIREIKELGEVDITLESASK